VFSALCDKLLDIDEKLHRPAAGHLLPVVGRQQALTIKLRQGVTFHDGEKFDAAAVKFNIERHKTLPGSQPQR
jgi:peptide/nickel transport system substrate-binding protein